MSQISSVGTGGGGGGGIETITGDVGSITGTNVTIFADQAANNAGASVKFVNSGTVSTFNLTDSVGNTYLGLLCGKLTSTGSNNTGVGVGALEAISDGTECVAIGASALASFTGNGVGVGANVAVGVGAGDLLLTGISNLFLGTGAGSLYTSSESENILLGSGGVPGESNVIRLGETVGGAAQTKCFIAAITGVTVSASAPTAIDANSQVSSLGFGTSTQVLTSNGPGVSPSWQAAGGGGFGSPTYFSAYRSTPQSLPGNTMTQVVFDTTIANVGSAYSTSTGFFTAPVTGFYGFSGTIMVSPIGVGITTLDLGFLGSVYGTTSFQIDSAAFATSGQYQATFSWNIPMTAGDTLGVNIYATGVASSTINGGALGATFNSQTLFSGYRIA